MSHPVYTLCINSESNSILCFDRNLGFFEKFILVYKCLIIKENNHTKAFSLKLWDITEQWDQRQRDSLWLSWHSAIWIFLCESLVAITLIYIKFITENQLTMH